MRLIDADALKESIVTATLEEEIKNNRKKTIMQFIIAAVILALALFIQYKIAVSDLDPWIKFLLLR